MLTDLVSLITKSFQPPAVVKPVVTTNKNPFGNSENKNIFLSNSSFKGSENYGKNMPVSGGYFAGYHNDKPNIVGRKLFIEA